MSALVVQLAPLGSVICTVPVGLMLVVAVGATETLIVTACPATAEAGLLVTVIEVVPLFTASDVEPELLLNNVSPE